MYTSSRTHGTYICTHSLKWSSLKRVARGCARACVRETARWTQPVRTHNPHTIAISETQGKKGKKKRETKSRIRSTVHLLKYQPCPKPTRIFVICVFRINIYVYIYMYPHIHIYKYSHVWIIKTTTMTIANARYHHHNTKGSCNIH